MDAALSGKKLFAKDKNYILKEVQAHTCQPLLETLRDLSVEMYFESFNPLRLQDDTTKAIQRNMQADTSWLLPFYNELAGIYRYKFGETQLEFLFDGTSHFEKYTREWMETFLKWTHDLGKHKHFVRAVLEATALRHEHMREELIHQRLKSLLAQVFDVKVYRYRGIQQLTA